VSGGRDALTTDDSFARNIKEAVSSTKRRGTNRFQPGSGTSLESGETSSTARRVGRRNRI